MALHFPILVNGQPIGSVYIRRLHELVPGEASNYTVETNYPIGEVRTTTVLHDYDDGALVLIQKALAEIIEIMES